MRTTSIRSVVFALASAVALALLVFGPETATARVVEDVPEIDPGVLRGALALAAGGVAVLADRLRRR